METIFGREYECEQLQRVVESNESELVVVYGRRRVGKTFLVNSFFNNEFAFKLTGVYNQSAKLQLQRFAVTLEECGGEASVPKDWFQAFDNLRHYLRSLSDRRRKIVFIDEMPWLDTHNSNFVAALESFWNGWAAAEGNIVLIACGSATSWMTNTLLGDKGGLFNRSSVRIFVRPFTLGETEQYLRGRGLDWTRYDIAECYMIMGGIPFYLKQLSPSLSYTQNIDNIFFRERGVLWDEFSHLYNTLFLQPENYIAVVEALASKRMGLTRKEIIAITKMPDNGKLGAILRNLEGNEFIRSYSYYGNKKRETIYQLCDFYTMFYFSFIRNNNGKDQEFWTHSIDLPRRRAWAGFTFEQLCMAHINQIRKAIGIGGVLCETSSWFSKGTEQGTDGLRKRGAQIDLLIERRDRVINICEIKFSLNQYTIDADYYESLRRKIETFREESKTHKSLQLVMITTYGVKPGKYSNLVHSQVVLDDLF